MLGPVSYTHLAVSVTTAVPVVWLTSAWLTPSNASRAFFTEASQCPHIIPSVSYTHLGTPVVKIGVLHPVESYWLKFGPNQQTGQERAEMEEHFKEITEWLLFDLLDYDYVSESLLKDQYQDGKIGAMDYEVLIVPGMHTIRQTTLDVLEDFRKRGKQVIFLGEIPALVDADPSKAAAETAKKCTCIPFSRNRLLTELEPYRQVDIHYDLSLIHIF